MEKVEETIRVVCRCFASFFSFSQASISYVYICFFFRFILKMFCLTVDSTELRIVLGHFNVCIFASSLHMKKKGLTK